MLFGLMVFFSEIIGIGICVMMGLWFGHFRDGYAWRENPKEESNYHPLFMTIAMQFLFGNGILLFRIFPKSDKFFVKLGHTGAHLGAIIFSVAGIIASWDYHDLSSPPLANLYSLHGWVGIITLAFFLFQWVLGLAAYLLPCLPGHIKKMYMPHHLFWGITLFGMAGASTLSGIVEKSFILVEEINYTFVHQESIFINFMGTAVAVYTVLVGYVVVKSEYKRPAPAPLPGPPTEKSPLVPGNTKPEAQV